MAVVERVCELLVRTGQAGRVERFKRRLGKRLTVLSPGAGATMTRLGAWLPENRRYVLASLEVALEQARGSALVTGPVDKRFFEGRREECVGHTEFLSRRLEAPDPLMLFDAGRYLVALLTRHLPLARVADEVVEQRLRRAVELTRGYMGPRPDPAGRPMAVAGVDPHCGEWGRLAATDLTVRGWVEELRSEGHDLEGPFSADTLFRPGFWKRYSVVFCWYHDQGMIPVKLLSFHQAVNITLGLPLFRAGPAHGVGYDIAWTGQAGHGSMLRALNLALELHGR